MDSSVKSIFIHERGACESTSVGDGTRIWANAHVQEGATIGTDCNIGETCFVERGAVLGNGCVVKNGVSIWDGVELEDGVFVGPNAVFTNDLVPRTKLIRPDYQLVKTRVEYGASIGANVTIVCGVTLGRFSMIGAGAVVTKDVPLYALVVGNPAKIIGWVSKSGTRLEFNAEGFAECDGEEYVFIPALADSHFNHSEKNNFTQGRVQCLDEILQEQTT